MEIVEIWHTKCQGHKKRWPHFSSLRVRPCHAHAACIQGSFISYSGKWPNTSSRQCMSLYRVSHFILYISVYTFNYYRYRKLESLCPMYRMVLREKHLIKFQRRFQLQGKSFVKIDGKNHVEHCDIFFKTSYRIKKHTYVICMLSKNKLIKIVKVYKALFCIIWKTMLSYKILLNLKH